MHIRLWRRVVIASFGVVVFLTGVNPSDASANLAKWIGLIAYVPEPDPSVLRWGLAVAGSLSIVGLLFGPAALRALLNRERRPKRIPEQKSLEVISDASLSVSTRGTLRRWIRRIRHPSGDPFAGRKPLPGHEELGRVIVDAAGAVSGSPANYEATRGSTVAAPEHSGGGIPVHFVTPDTGNYLPNHEVFTNSIVLSLTSRAKGTLVMSYGRVRCSVTDPAGTTFHCDPSASFTPGFFAATYPRDFRGAPPKQAGRYQVAWTMSDGFVSFMGRDHIIGQEQFDVI